MPAKETPEINKNGCEVIRDFSPGDRYQYDFGLCSEKKGWIQYDTDSDAHYFGIWVHIEKRLIFTYCEGDLILVRCPTIKSFKAELNDMQDFHGDPPPWAVAYDLHGNKTEYYDLNARPEV